MLEIIKHPWHWSVAGVMIGLTVPILLLLGNKTFGISSNLRHICAACFPANIPFFKYNWKKEIWNLFFIGGVLIGGFIGAQFLQNPEPFKVAAETQSQLQAMGIQNFDGYAPSDVFNIENILSLKGLVFFVLGGFLVGFGTRWAGGCTSGHAIMGLSNLQLPSLVATISFMVGGFLMTWLGLPLFFSFF